MKSVVKKPAVIVLLLVFVFMGGLAEAEADRTPPGSRDWIETVRSSARTFALDYELVELSSDKLDPKVRLALEAIAVDQAQVWADTILEGEYVAVGAVALDKVQKVTRSGEMLGYRITYSSKAWDTSNCHAENAGFDPDCIEGRIVEASFVSPGLDYWFRDFDAYATFISSSAFSGGDEARQ